jgi:hypothetical protein
MFTAGPLHGAGRIIEVRVATAWSTLHDTSEALETAYTEIEQELGDRPSYILVSFTESHDSLQVAQGLSRLAPDVPVHGGTSCQGIMTREGYHKGFALGLWAVYDPEGSYGVGCVRKGDTPRRSATQALEAALEHADRVGEVPALIWLCGAPGFEEEVLRGIEDVVGSRAPVTGGSSADDAVAGKWKQICNGQVYQDAVVVTIMLPSCEVTTQFQSGFEPTEHGGRVTRADGRTLYEIDGRPAAQVYNEWSGGAISDTLAAGGSVVNQTTLAPLGREVGRIGNIPYFSLTHPDRATPEGALTLFSNLNEGDQLLMMRGSLDSLASRAGRVVRSVTSEDHGVGRPLGAIVTFCAGAMMAIQDRMQEVVVEISNELQPAPFIGLFTLGEQGSFLGGEIRHANLMITTVVFRERG